MSLRNQPYFPLYVQDFLTDEKLNECCALSTGVYIKIMCVMHKNENYGVILLRQKDKQGDNQALNFARKIAKHINFDVCVIEEALKELILEKVVKVEGDKLIQLRMIRDNEVSIKRAEAGSKGGKKTQSDLASAKANIKANSENENENEFEDETKPEAEKKKKKKPEEIRHKYGEYKKVLLTDKQHSNLVKRYGADGLQYLIKKLDEGIQMKGYKYDDFNLAIHKWAKDDPNVKDSQKEQQPSLKFGETGIGKFLKVRKEKNERKNIS